MDRTLRYGGAAVLLALALSVLLWWLTRPDDLELTGQLPPTTTSTEVAPQVDEDAPDTTAPRNPDAPAAPPEPTPTLDPDDPATQQIEEIIEFVEDARGLEFLEQPFVQVIDDAAFVAEYQQLVDEGFAEDPEGFEAFERIYWALGFLDPDLSLREVESAFGDAGIVGFYNTEVNELFVRSNGGDLTPYVKTVVAHELVHALEDQHFELFRPEYDDLDDERAFGLAALAEGSANRIENMYIESLSDDERSAYAAERGSLGGDVDFSLFTSSYLELVLAPYDFGEPLVYEIVEREGEAGLEAAFLDPPETAELVMHPDRYFAGEGYLDVAPPPAEGPVVEDGLVGEVALRAMLSAVAGPNTASAAADGWAGDWYVLWYEGERACLRMDVVMDTVDDADELRSGLSALADILPDAEVSTAADVLTRFTSCVEG